MEKVLVVDSSWKKLSNHLDVWSLLKKNKAQKILSSSLVSCLIDRQIEGAKAQEGLFHLSITTKV